MFLKKYRIIYLIFFIVFYPLFAYEKLGDQSAPVNLYFNVGSPTNNNHVEQNKSTEITQNIIEYLDIIKTTLNEAYDKHVTSKLIKNTFYGCIGFLSIYILCKAIKQHAKNKIEILDQLKEALNYNAHWINFLLNTADSNKIIGISFIKKLALMFYVNKYQLHKMNLNEIISDIYLVDSWIDITRELNLIEDFIQKYEHFPLIYKMYYFSYVCDYKKYKRIKNTIKILEDTLYNLLLNT